MFFYGCILYLTQYLLPIRIRSFLHKGSILGVMPNKSYRFFAPTSGTKKALDALINTYDGRLVTYRQTTNDVTISINTLKSHFRRIRRNDPDTYYYAMNLVRKTQLVVRHE